MYKIYRAAARSTKLCSRFRCSTAVNPVFVETNSSGNNESAQFQASAKVGSSTSFIHPSWRRPITKQDLESFRQLDSSFSIGENAYKSKSSLQLFRAWAVLRLCTIDMLVNHQKTLDKILRRIVGKRLYERIMRATFYGQFVAGKDQADMEPTIARHWKFGVKSILDYAAEADLSEDAAKKLTKASTTAKYTPEDGSGETNQQHVPEHVDKYRPHLEFGDRRNTVYSSRTFFYEDEQHCDYNMWHFMKCIDAVSGSTRGTGFAAIKLTALGPPQFLMQLSEVLHRLRVLFDKISTQSETDRGKTLRRIQRESFRTGLEQLGVPISRDECYHWFTLLDTSGTQTIDLFEWSNLINLKHFERLFTVVDSATGHLRPLVPDLGEIEQEQLHNMILRLNRLAEHAAKMDVRLMIDAEQSYFQPAISRLTVELMRKFNREKAIVFNTYQCYLKKALHNLELDLELARNEDFYFGAKAVRGAYMEQERSRAAAIGYEDPINPTYDATSKMMEGVIQRAIQEAKAREMGKVAVMIASHNENTVRYTVEQMEANGILPKDRIICFGQLLGMCDHVSFSLGQAGFSVYKYVPYGPVTDVIPYLTRRAQENRGMLTKVEKERSMQFNELKRRIRSGSFWYNPMSPAVIGVNK